MKIGRVVVTAACNTVICLTVATCAIAGPLEDADEADRRKEYSVALKLVVPLAEQGNAGAQRRLGFAYTSGRGVPVDYAEAEKWFRLAATQGDLDSIWNIDFIHHQGRGTVPKNFAEGAKWYLRAAERGHIGSQNALALAYFSGDGVERDYATASKWYLRAANQGNKDAQALRR